LRRRTGVEKDAERRRTPSGRFVASEERNRRAEDDFENVQSVRSVGRFARVARGAVVRARCDGTTRGVE
jgi:hypothetical protein